VRRFIGGGELKRLPIGGGINAFPDRKKRRRGFSKGEGTSLKSGRKKKGSLAHWEKEGGSLWLKGASFQNEENASIKKTRSPREGEELWETRDKKVAGGV